MSEPASYAVNEVDLPALREIIANLVRTGYTEDGVRDRLGLLDLGDLEWRSVPMYRDEGLAARDRLALAIDLFLLQGTLPVDEMDRLFVGADREILKRTGLLEIDGTGSGRSRASLFPVGNRLIFSDHAWPQLPHPGYATVPYEQVMFVGADSRALARCTLRQPVRSALDLCTGSGIQAVLASAHSQRVLAVDINPRAALCTRFNAQVSGAQNLDVITGDLFGPVRGEQFDLITANPPFVPSPLDTLRFRDGGRSGEEIQSRIVSGLPQHLSPGGTAQMITELGEREGEPLTGRLREWLGGAPMDIHVLRVREYTAAKYAIGHAKGDEYGAFLDSIQSWAGNLRNQGYVRVVAVLITFQWSDAACGPPWERVEETQIPQRAAGMEIEAMLAAERRAHKPGLREILEHGRLRRAGPVALLDAQVLGREIRANTKATLLGQALPVEHHLDVLEREVLLRMEKPVRVAELVTIFHEFNVSKESSMTAIASLLRRRLISLEVQVARSGAGAEL